MKTKLQANEYEYNSNSIIRTKGGAELFRKRWEEAEILFPCYLKHSNCSPDLYGPCADETLSNFPELEESK